MLGINYPHQERSQPYLRTTLIKAKPQRPQLKRPRLSSIGQVKAATRREYAPEDNIHTGLEGFRRDVTSAYEKASNRASSMPGQRNSLPMLAQRNRARPL